MKENKTTVNGGIGFTGLLTIVFIVLKLTNIIKWSWFWVLSPIWIEIALAIVGFGIYATVVIIRSRKRKAERQRKIKESAEKMIKERKYEFHNQRD